MPIGSGAPFLLRRHTMKLAAGTRLFHVYPGTRDPLSANPAAKARFARPGVASMYYTANSTDIAIWEIVLRDKIYVGDTLVLDVAELSPWKIAEVELLRDVQFISLEERHLGHVAATVFAKIRLRECCGCDPDEYPKTHDAANRLIAVSPGAEAIAGDRRNAASHIACSSMATTCLHLRSEPIYSESWGARFFWQAPREGRWSMR